MCCVLLADPSQGLFETINEMFTAATAMASHDDTEARTNVSACRSVLPCLVMAAVAASMLLGCHWLSASLGLCSDRARISVCIARRVFSCVCRSLAASV